MTSLGFPGLSSHSVSRAKELVARSSATRFRYRYIMARVSVKPIGSSRLPLAHPGSFWLLAASIYMARQLELPFSYVAHCLGHAVRWDVFVPLFTIGWPGSVSFVRQWTSLWPHCQSPTVFVAQKLSLNFSTPRIPTFFTDGPRNFALPGDAQVKPARTKLFRQAHKPILLEVNSRLLNFI